MCNLALLVHFTEKALAEDTITICNKLLFSDCFFVCVTF